MPNGRKPRLLIVDDEPSNVLVLQRLVAGAGIDPGFATSDPTKAVELFLSCNPDLVILDLNMPGMDGFEFLAALKLAVPPECFPSVLVVTGDADPATRKRALAVGAKDFINKPFDPDEVRLRIGNLLVAELRDDVMGQHNGRVARMAFAIAEAIGPRSESAKLLGRVAALHDIGKIGIPDRILLKTGPLTGTEWDTMKTHTTIGARILSSGRSEFMRLAKEIARSHHERWDGGGYPDGLRSTQIPLAARIVTIADVFDALSSDRPYRPAYTVREAREAIEIGSGTLFDPSLVKVFRGVFAASRVREGADAGDVQAFLPVPAIAAVRMKQKSFLAGDCMPA